MTETIQRKYLLTERFYPPACLDRTIREFTSLCDVNKVSVGRDTAITIICRPGAPKQTPEEFMNFLLCASLEMLLD